MKAIRDWSELCERVKEEKAISKLATKKEEELAIQKMKAACHKAIRVPCWSELCRSKKKAKK